MFSLSFSLSLSLSPSLFFNFLFSSSSSSAFYYFFFLFLLLFFSSFFLSFSHEGLVSLQARDFAKEERLVRRVQTRCHLGPANDDPVEALCVCLSDCV